MLQIRKANERGKVNHGWLQANHTFSFGEYYDPKYIHFSHLRVINEDFIAAQQGFGMHPHNNMEILTYVLSGRVAHQDSMGNKTEVNAGEFQLMSAGSGILHSEINPSDTEPLHLYQIWIIPNEKEVTPRYSQQQFTDKTGATLILSPNGEQGAFKIYQNMKLWRYQYPNNFDSEIRLETQRHYWLQLVKGELTVNQRLLTTSDGMAISDETLLRIQTHSEVEFLLFDLV